MFDWTALFPILIFLPFFAWIVFQRRRRSPLTDVELRGTVGVGVIAITLGVILLSGMLIPNRALPTLTPSQAFPARVAPPPVPAVPPLVKE